MRTPFLVIASHRRWRGNPVNYARAYARLYYDWIATVAMLPRDDKKHHTQFPSMEGCRAAAGWSEKPRQCHIFVIASVTWQSLLYRCVPQCVARALMRPVRILVFVQTALSLVFTYSLFPRLTPAGILVFVQTALALVFTYSDSLRAIADGAAIQ